MNISSLVAEARAKGVSLWIEGERVKCRGPAQAVEALLPKLRADRAAIIGELTDGVPKEKRNVYQFKLEGQSSWLTYISPDGLSEVEASLRSRFRDRLLDVRPKYEQT